VTTPRSTSIVSAAELIAHSSRSLSRPMIAEAQARQSLEQLGLAEAAAVLDGRREAASQKQLPTPTSWPIC
jgi:hypothetical protein